MIDRLAGMAPASPDCSTESGAASDSGTPSETARPDAELCHNAEDPWRLRWRRHDMLHVTRRDSQAR